MTRELTFQHKSGAMHYYHEVKKPGKLVLTRNIDGVGWEPMPEGQRIACHCNLDSLKDMYLEQSKDWVCVLDTQPVFKTDTSTIKCTCDFNWPNTFLGCRCGAFKAERHGA